MMTKMALSQEGHARGSIGKANQRTKPWGTLKVLRVLGALMLANDLSGCCLAEGITREGLSLVINYSHWLNYWCLLTLYDININVPIHTKLMHGCH